MLSLTDQQLDIIAGKASELVPEKRSTYLERVAAILMQRAGRHTTADVVEAAEMALRSLTQREAVA